MVFVCSFNVIYFLWWSLRMRWAEIVHPFVENSTKLISALRKPSHCHWWLDFPWEMMSKPRLPAVSSWWVLLRRVYLWSWECGASVKKTTMVGSPKPYESKETEVKLQISKTKGKIFIEIYSHIRIYIPPPHPPMTRLLCLALKGRAVTGEIKPFGAVETKLRDKIESVVNRKKTLEAFRGTRAGTQFFSIT